MSLTIVADDLTGACDTGCLFAGNGPVPLALWPAAPPRAGVRVVDTETASMAMAILARAIERRLDRGTSDAEIAALVERFRLRDGTTFGIIASVTQPFCRTCDRSRLTADGTWFLCLYAGQGVDLREPLRQIVVEGQSCAHEDIMMLNLFDVKMHPLLPAPSDKRQRLPPEK